MDDEPLISAGSRLRQLARARPDQPVAIHADASGELTTVTLGEFDRRTNRLARLLAGRGVTSDDNVAIGLPNGIAHLEATWAAWKLGACPVPLAPRLPVAERDRFLDLARPAAVIADWPGSSTVDPGALSGFDDGELASYPIPSPWKALGSGGSTGAPKLIVSPSPFAFPATGHPLAAALQITDGVVCFSPGPLSHNQAFLFSHMAIYQGGTAVICDRFRADVALRTIEATRARFLNVVPTMMSRMLQDPGLEVTDLSSLEVVFHMAAPCPDWVKRGWISLVGAKKVYELWGATEQVGMTVIRGDEWLEHPGSVGRPIGSEVKVLDPATGAVLPAGEIGEIWSRFTIEPGQEQYRYLGADPLPVDDEGFANVGDLGHLDEDGYLHLADRRTDLIISGGANIYPAEVEQAISSHPAVADVVVVGLRDEDLGRRVHAIVEARATAAAPSEADLSAHVRGQLAPYKVPRSWEFIESLPRSDAGKVRRGQLRDERDDSRQRIRS